MARTTQSKDVTHVSLTTAESAVTVPPDLDFTARNVTCGCVSGGAFITWQRRPVDASLSVTCLDSKESVDVGLQPGQTAFYASLSSGTGTLECEWFV